MKYPKRKSRNWKSFSTLTKMPLPTITTHTLNHAAIGARVRKLRASKHISLRSLALAMYISAPYLSGLERGSKRWTKARHGQAVRCIKTLTLIESIQRSNKAADRRKGGTPKGKV